MVLGTLLLLIGLLGYMFYLNMQLAAWFLLILPFALVLIAWLRHRIRRYSRQIQSGVAEINQMSTEAIEGHPEIKIFQAHEQRRNYFAGVNHQVRNRQIKQDLIKEAAPAFMQMLISLALAIMIWVFLSVELLNTLPPADLVIFIGVVVLLYSPVRRLAAVVVPWQQCMVAAKDVFTTLALPVEPPGGSFEVPRAKGSITFKDVCFHYPSNPERPVLNELSFTIKPGQTVALVGDSGGGKSTIIKLLMRFYDCQQGEILIDGVPIGDYQLPNLRRQIAMVSQHPAMFNDTVFNNIALGSPNPSEVYPRTLEKAAEKAYATDFILHLPQGMQTPIGDRGLLLSGGQRQRLAIARALLKDAPILVLDEATSSLDSRSEHWVRKGLANVAANRTTLVIAHRLSTVENADRIFVIHKGQLAEAGSHKNLLQRQGLYHDLYHRQFAPAEAES